MRGRWVVVLGLAAAVCVGCGDDDSGDDVGDVPEDVEETTDGADADADADADVDVSDGADDAADGADDGGGGCEQEFWIWDLSVMPPRDTQICTSLRGEGTNEYVWVEDVEWGPHVDEMGVTEILRRWDVETPAESTAPDQGIFEILTGIFGPPPDAFDADPKIYILLYGMEPFGSAEFDGYFRSDDMTSSATSNRHEMIHINSRARNPVASDYMIGVMAHEFHHMLQWGLDRSEESWLSESFAETAMLLTGYRGDMAAANSWSRSPRAPLIVDGVGSPVDYGAAFLFGAYLLDRLSASGLADLVADTADGAASVETAVRTVDADATFVGFFAEFAAALYADDETIGDGRYALLDLDPSTPTPISLSFPATAAPVTVPGGGILFARVPIDGRPAGTTTTYTVDVTAGDALALGARLIVEDPTAGSAVHVLEPGTPLTVADVPDTATGLVFALATDETLSVTAAVSASEV